MGSPSGVAGAAGEPHSRRHPRRRPRGDRRRREDRAEDAVDAPIDCATLQASFEAAERSAGAAVTPIDRVPSGATSACSHQFGSSGYAVSIYNDPSSGEDGAIGQAFVQAACGAFLHVAGGS
ncbi:MAG: hypothetical protein E6J03_07435 [Chloroflexi bacterium]|nr:MAG: hypothetical protein E6J03_07435 [Chloroflexota bacterium]